LRRRCDVTTSTARFDRKGAIRGDDRDLDHTKRTTAHTAAQRANHP
jgi:hypothetical protein